MRPAAAARAIPLPARRPLLALATLATLVTALVSADERQCRAGDTLVPGDLVIYGLFPYLAGDDCDAVSEYGRQLETAATWAVRRVNSLDVLHGAVLGLRSYPICTSSSSLATVTTTQAYTDSTDPRCVGGQFTGFLSPPLPAASSALLDELPVTRATVSDAGGAALAETLAEVAAELGWTAVAVVTDDRGERAARLVEHVEYLGVCVVRWVTVAGRQLAAFSELSSLPADSQLIGLFDVTQLSLRQLSGLHWVLGLRQPGQLATVPDGALVAFDTATEVSELTAALAGSRPAETRSETVSEIRTETAPGYASTAKTGTETAGPDDSTADPDNVSAAFDSSTASSDAGTAGSEASPSGPYTDTSEPDETTTDWGTTAGSTGPAVPGDAADCGGCAPFVPNPAAVRVVRAVYNYARSLQLRLGRLCPAAASCDPETALRDRPPLAYADHGQAFVAALGLRLLPENHTVYRAGPGQPRPVGWRAGSQHRLQLGGEPGRPPADAAPCPALFTQPVRWRVRVWTTVLATLAAVGGLACLCFLAFYAAVSRRALEHGQGWMMLLVVATALQYAATAPYFLQQSRLMCALRLQAPALGLAAPLAVLLSRALSLAAAHTTRGGIGHVSGWLQTILCFFIFLVQVGISAERWISLRSPGGAAAHESRCSETREQQLLALAYVSFLQVLQFVLSPWVALCSRNYWEGPLTAGYTCLAAALWSAALTFYWLDVPLLDSSSPAAHLCLGLVVTASASLVVVHLPRVLLLTREAAAAGALPYLHRYRDRSLSHGLAGAAAMLHSPLRRRGTLEINEAVGLHQMDGGRPAGRDRLQNETPPSPPPPPQPEETEHGVDGGRRNHAFQPDDALSVGDAETMSAHSETKYPASEMQHRLAPGT